MDKNVETLDDLKCPKIKNLHVPKRNKICGLARAIGSAISQHLTVQSARQEKIMKGLNST